jgi:hypothetical protein
MSLLKSGIILSNRRERDRFGFVVGNKVECKFEWGRGRKLAVRLDAGWLELLLDCCLVWFGFGFVVLCLMGLWGRNNKLRLSPTRNRKPTSEAAAKWAVAMELERA